MTKTITKHIAKLKKIPHPKSRKTAQLTRKVLKASTREKAKHSHLVKTNVLGEKLMWFKEYLAPYVGVCSPESILQCVESYLCRFDEELNQINLKHNLGKHRGRQHASREDAIKMTQQREKQEFDTCGIEMPDVLNPKQLNLLQNWSGELRFLQNFKLVRYNRDTLESLCESSSEEDTM